MPTMRESLVLTYATLCLFLLSAITILESSTTTPLSVFRLEYYEHLLWAEHLLGSEMTLILSVAKFWTTFNLSKFTGKKKLGYFSGLISLQSDAALWIEDIKLLVPVRVAGKAMFSLRRHCIDSLFYYIYDMWTSSPYSPCNLPASDRI